MKKKILIVASLVLLLLVSVLAFGDGIKGKWTIVPIRGKLTWVKSESTTPVVIRWDYYVLDDNGKMVVKAPGAYPGAFKDSDYYQFYVEEFPIQYKEEFILPRSVYNLYVKASSDRVKVQGTTITITD